jgi:signal transduction histidine kinase
VTIPALLVPPRGRPRAGRQLAVFLATAALVLTSVSVGAVLLTQGAAQTSARQDGEQTAQHLAHLVVAPLLGGALAGDPVRRSELDRVIATGLEDGTFASILVWMADGTILYSHDPRLIGRQVAPTPDLLAALDGHVVSDVVDAPELGSALSSGQLLEVYTPLRIEGRPPLALETYVNYDQAKTRAVLLQSKMIPLIIGALTVLQLVQIPIAVTLARRVARQEAERTELVRRALTASEQERREIAADVHDGPVQNIAGVGLALSALRARVPEPLRAPVDRLSEEVREAVLSLRHLMIDIYPPDLTGSGVSDAIRDLAAPLRAQGLTVEVDAGRLPEVSAETAAALYRTAREALANVLKHASASAVWVCLEEIDSPAGPAVRLHVEDDGVGLPATGIDKRAEGHLGLRLVLDRITDLGGTARVGPRPGGGTAVTVVLPVDRTSART